MRFHTYLLSCFVLILCLDSVFAAVPAAGRRQLSSPSAQTPAPSAKDNGFSSVSATPAPSGQSSDLPSSTSGSATKSSSIASTVSQTSATNASGQQSPTSSAGMTHLKIFTRILLTSHLKSPSKQPTTTQTHNHACNGNQWHYSNSLRSGICDNRNKEQMVRLKYDRSTP